MRYISITRAVNVARKNNNILYYLLPGTGVGIHYASTV